MRFLFVAQAGKHAPHRLTASVVVGLLLAIIVAVPAMALTVEEYCTLSRDLMALSVREWREKARVANRNQNASKEELSSALQAVEQTYRAQREQRYASYATTYDDYMRFMNTDGRAVRSYLDNNPDLMNEIDDLSGQVEGFAQQVEAVMETKQEGIE
ncbi:hypothetical protein [Candidatus Thiosymbion oneisti]|uniref:hypothetical protein n=1 Tax=Candidatus Thiosymbion oneisti TaxID=589554 RepID=UPI000B7F7FB3|nr:hypothetical protein [Candidatus Thiosymbion oneisti]